MTSSPPPFDDGGDLPETRLEDPDVEDYGPEPNYLVRRAVAVGLIVAVLAGGSVVAGRIIGGDGGGDTTTAAGDEWNTAVVIADDEVRLVDPVTGDVTETIPGEEALLDTESLIAGDQLVLMNDFGRITQLDLTDGTIHRSSAPDESTLTTSAENAAILLAAPPTGGDISVIDTRSATTIDIGDVAGLADPLMFVDTVLVSPSGSHVGAADARSFQSVVVDVEARTATLLAGQIVALNDATALTAQRAGASAELEFYDLTGKRRGSADTSSPVVTLLTGDSKALTVSADGEITTVNADGSTDVVGPLIPAETGASSPSEVSGGALALESTRVLVRTVDEVVLLAPDGAIITSAPGELLSPVGSGTTCALVGSTQPTGAAVHLDLTTGDVLGEGPGGLVASASVDGCTLSMIGEPRVIVRGVEADLDVTVGSITIAPDGSAYVLTTTIRDRLIDLTDDGEPVDLADEPVLVRFAEI